MSSSSAVQARDILGMRVDAVTYQQATERIIAVAASGGQGVVCAANVHMVMAAHHDPELRMAINRSLLVTPDGMPLVGMLRGLGVPGAKRVYGPTLMLEVCAAAAAGDVPIALYGGEEATVATLEAELVRRYPDLRIVHRCSPPFRPATAEEDQAQVDAINASGARLLFVALGCPKQERWMDQHRDRLPLVQLGVGAAFAFHAGLVSQAPAWIQRLSLEWLYRLCMEPRRLWYRYLSTIPAFIPLAALQVVRYRTGFMKVVPAEVSP
jgi:N-acetylglucosaminyldiphosphoundecaprenol N-acetyl-beta-D-mannosaminyltransferase